MPMHEHDRRRTALPPHAAATVPAASAAGPAHAAGAVGPRDQLAIVDALYRFGAGQDLRDRALLASAFAADATLDFSQPAGRFGVALARSTASRSSAVLADLRVGESGAGPDSPPSIERDGARWTSGTFVYRGRDAIVDAIFAAIGALDTTHTVTNPRVTHYDGERAGLFALVEAQHLPRGDHRRHLLLKNLYHVDLVRHDGLWLIERLRIDTVWSAGDPAVLFPHAPPVATEEHSHG
ncbi:MAG TPA: nuclear transport factor 2 family protein [Dokdonella sp.]|nr:nuclear transport factor 2 family protein [Dokdonella sp.]